jgi:hypothetical protein
MLQFGRMSDDGTPENLQTSVGNKPAFVSLSNP